MSDTDDVSEILGARDQDITKLQEEVDAAGQQDTQERREEPREDLSLSDDAPRREQPEQREDTQERDAPMVPAQRLREATERARQAEQAAERERARMDELERRQQMFQELYEGQQKAREEQLKPKEETPPDPEQDVVGYARWMRQQHEKAQEEIRSLKQGQERTQQQTERQQLVQDLRSRALTDAEQFARETPDFYDAYHYLREGRIRELTAVGVPMQNAVQHVDNEELQLNAHSIRNRQNIASNFYAMAKARGWQGKPQGENVHQLRPEQQPQRQQSPAFQEPPPPAHRQTMANMEAGMRQSRTLDEASTGGTVTPPSLESLANMSEADFAANYDRAKQMMRRNIA